MPVEIRELQINVTVNQPGGNSTSSSIPPSFDTNSEDEKKALIRQCIEQVLDIFENKKER